MIWLWRFALKYGSAMRRREAAAGLGRSRDRRAVGPLIAALDDSEEFVRWAAVEALRKIKDPSATASLVTLLLREVETDTHRDQDRKVTPLIVNALVAIGRSVVKELETICSHESPKLRLAVVEVLRWVEDERASALLIERMMNDSDWQVGRFAARSLERCRWRPETVEQRIALALRLGSFENLRDIGTDVIQPIVDALDLNPSPEWKLDAYRFLGELGDPRAVPILLDGLDCSELSPYPWPNDKVKEAEEEVIRQLLSYDSAVTAALPGYLARAKDMRPEYMLPVSNIASLVAELGDGALAVVKAQLASDSAQMKWHAVAILRWTAGKSVKLPVGAILEILHDSNVNVRKEGIFALSAHNVPEAAPAFCKILAEDPEPKVREAAASGLVGLGDIVDATPFLRALGDQDLFVRLIALEALGTRREPRAVEPLITLLHKKDKEETRHKAIESLGKIGGLRAMEEIAALNPTSLANDQEGVAMSNALSQLLEAHAAEVSVSVLQKIAALKDSYFFHFGVIDGFPRHREVSFVNAIKLALKELKLRHKNRSEDNV